MVIKWIRYPYLGDGHQSMNRYLYISIMFGFPSWDGCQPHSSRPPQELSMPDSPLYLFKVPPLNMNHTRRATNRNSSIQYTMYSTCVYIYIYVYIYICTCMYMYHVYHVYVYQQIYSNILIRFIIYILYNIYIYTMKTVYIYRITYIYIYTCID